MYCHLFYGSQCTYVSLVTCEYVKFKKVTKIIRVKDTVESIADVTSLPDMEHLKFVFYIEQQFVIFCGVNNNNNNNNNSKTNNYCNLIEAFDIAPVYYEAYNAVSHKFTIFRNSADS